MMGSTPQPHTLPTGGARPWHPLLGGMTWRHLGGKVLASNPGPHHHRICDRREEGLVKPPFWFASFPTIVGNMGKISHSNYLA